jgi:membrane-associated phospholipid phosphatase
MFDEQSKRVSVGVQAGNGLTAALDGCGELRDHLPMLRRPGPILIVAWMCALGALPARAADEARTVEPEVEPMPGLFDGLAGNVSRAFFGPNFAFHLAAVAATATMTTQDVDFQVRDYFHQHQRWGQAEYPVVKLGVAGPVLLLAGLHGAAWLTHDHQTLGAGFAVLQAGGVMLSYVTLLKLVTGRPAPRDDYVPGVAPDMESLSRTFRPGFYRGGVIAGWPSGHVAVTTAMLASLVTYYPRSVWLKVALVIGSTGMMLGVSSYDAGGMHWCSDAVAGALMALPIGFESGRGMRRLVGNDGSDGNDAASLSSAWFLTPSLVPGTTGALVGRSF